MRPMRFGAPFTRSSTAPPRARPTWLAVWGLSWLLCTTAAAQYRFDQWTTEHGLPQNSVLAITQTRDGYLWLATYNGLVRFDGVRFTVFDKTNTKGMKTSRYWELFEDPSGALWASSVDGVLRYQHGVFTTFSTEHGVPHNNIMQIQSDVEGTPLITTEATAVWWRNGRFSPYEVRGTDAELQLHLGRSGTHWLVDKNGLHARRRGQVTDYALPVKPRSPKNARLYEDRHGALWVMLERQGLFKVKDGVALDYTQRIKLSATEPITKMLEDRDGSFWLATSNAGLIHFKDAADATPTLYNTTNGLTSNAIRGLWQDREGTLWIGTDGAGLNRMTRQFISTYSEAQGLNGNIVHALLEDRAGNVWAATQTGLGKIADGRVSFYPLGTGPGQVPLQHLQALYEDRAGRLWIGGGQGFCFLQNGIFSAPVRKPNVWAIHEDRQGNLWIGTHYGLFKLKEGVTAFYTQRDGLPSDTIKAIHEDRHGVLWFGTHGGLVKYNDGRFTTFTANDGLVNDRIWSIHEDAEDMLWLGTFDSGLLRFKEGRFTRYTTAQGLFNNGSFQVLEDGQGNLWMSCYRGLYRVSKQQLNAYADDKIPALSSTAFGTAEGMLSADCNGGRQPSGIKTRDGRLWFTTLRGVAVLDPAEIKANPLPPPVLIESATLDGAATEIGNGLRVAPHQANLEINYTALSFIKAEQIRFKYQLLGQDPDWLEAGTRRTANYSYLSPGQYTFKVRAANSDGVWNTTGAQLPIVVLPAFYQTWWFRLLALLVSAGSVGWVFKLRLERAHRARRAQEEFSRRLIESQEHERKRIAAELHDSLGQNLLIIKNRALLGALNPTADAAAKEEFAGISDSAGQAIEETRHIAYNLRPYNLERLGLTNTIEEMLEAVAKTSGIRFTADLLPLDGALPPEGEINLYRVLQECVNNIVKHSGASEAVVEINRDPQALFIKIADNGRGFTPLAPAIGQRRSGFGLLGMTERVRLLNGELTIDSMAGRGTTIQIKIALRAAGLL